MDLFVLNEFESLVWFKNYLDGIRVSSYLGSLE